METIIVKKRFAGERHDIRDFVTPFTYEVKQLYEKVKGSWQDETLMNCWEWINEHVGYPRTPLGAHVDYHELKAFRRLYFTSGPDFWSFPDEVISQANHLDQCGRKTLGDCEDVSALMVSVLRNEVNEGDIYVGIGKVYAYGVLGHAWVYTRLNGDWYMLDPTLPPGEFIDPKFYENFVIFNDLEVHEIQPAVEILGGVRASL